MRARLPLIERNLFSIRLFITVYYLSFRPKPRLVLMSHRPIEIVAVEPMNSSTL